MNARIKIPFDEIAAFCERNHIRNLSLFGSVLDDAFRSDSDIDMLVEYDPDYVPGYITFSQMRLELSEIIGREVDLRTPHSLSRYFRNDILTNAEKIYAAK